MLPVEQIRARLDDRFRLLTGGSRTALPRQQTLRAAVDWSYGLLSEPERALFRRLSVFAGGWTTEAAEAIARPGRRRCGSLDLLGRLVDKSLVVLEAGPDPADVNVSGAWAGRFVMLETVHQYAGGEANPARRGRRGPPQPRRLLHCPGP